MLLTPRQAQFAFIPAMVTVMSATMTLYHHGLAPGLMSTWLNNWVLAFVVALPIAWVAVPATRALLTRLTQTARPAPARSLGEMG